MDGLRRIFSALTVAAAFLATLLGIQCSAPRDARLWTEAQAESITTIRGTPVTVRFCRGLDESGRPGQGNVYGRFSCLAGTRLPHEKFDSVAVYYVLRPLGPYVGASSRHALSDVRFEGLQIP